MVGSGGTGLVACRGREGGMRILNGLSHNTTKASISPPIMPVQQTATQPSCNLPFPPLPSEHTVLSRTIKRAWDC
jgi:hypothetical protein